MANGSFETDLSGWTFTSPFSPPLQESQSTAWATDGVASMDLVEQSPGAGVNTDTAKTTVALNGSPAYVFHTDVNAIAINNVATSQVEALIENTTTYQYTRRDYSIRDAGVASFDDVFNGVTMDTAVLSMLPSCYTTSCVTEFLVDNVQLRGLTGFFPNGDFATSDLSMWTTVGGSSIAYVADASGGHMEMTGSSGGAIIGTALLPLSPCSEYAVFLKVTVNSGSNPYPTLTWYDVSGTALPSATSDGSWLIPPAGAVKLTVEIDEYFSHDLRFDGMVLVGRP